MVDDFADRRARQLAFLVDRLKSRKSGETYPLDPYERELLLEAIAPMRGPLANFDPAQEAAGLTNELFYRDGAVPKALQPSDAMLVKETIERGLAEAVLAGRKSILGSADI